MGRAENLTKEGMLNGVAESAACIIFLSAGVLLRPYCQMEIRHALELKKPIVLLHEVSCGRDAPMHARFVTNWLVPRLV